MARPAGWQRDSDAVAAMQGGLEEVAGRISARAAVIEDDLITQGIPPGDLRWTGQARGDDAGVPPLSWT